MLCHRVGERNRGHVRCRCNVILSVVKQQAGDRQVRLLEIDAGGPSSLGCVEKDIRNYQRDVLHEILGHDAETLIEHFTFKKEKNPNFVFDYETGDENKFVRCFWADYESQRSYAYFGDVVVLNTTYNTNRGQASDEAKVYAVQRFEPGRTFDRTRQVNYFLSTDYISMPTYAVLHEKKQVMLLPEKYILRRWTKNAKQARVFDPTTGSYVHTDLGHSLMSRHNIDTSGDVGMSRNRDNSVEETQVICDPNPVRAKGCEKRLKSGKEKVLSQSNRQCRACGTSGHDRRTCPTLQNSLDNTIQPQYSQDPSDQNIMRRTHSTRIMYQTHSTHIMLRNLQYSIIGSNNASYFLDPQEYDE
ncbi:Protein FAR1-RELATED SEQUENCE [Abeliophyllum distichum]|uniref:Protein FAR1-RELATED SEQUENCE n=1 Tax=Abeliophyllum distichum TaxID=126358 RepID=A0ABD1Q5X9_9LAMI